MEISVVIPALNEAENLRHLLPELKGVLGSITESYEIIIADGGSTDNTAEIAKLNGAVFFRQRLPGFGSALKEGFACARGSYIITMDADLSHSPEFIKSIWANRKKADVIVASRYIKGASAQMPAYRYVLSRILNLFFAAGLSLPLKDISGNFRMYRQDILSAIQINCSGYEALEEILIRLLAKSWTIFEIPFEYRPRTHGSSHVRLFKFAVAYLRAFCSMWFLRNSIDFSDYDIRAYYSRIFIQRWWQRKRYKIVMGYIDDRTSLLDIGCGTSKIIIDLPSAVALDMNIGKLRYLKKTNPRLINADCNYLPFKDESFSAAICSQVIEHAEEKNIFNEINRVLKKNGILIIGTPDYGKIYWPAIERLYKFFHKGGYANEHINPYTFGKLQMVLKRLNFDILDYSYILKSELIIKAVKRA